MAFVKEIKTSLGRLGVWKLTESSEELCQLYELSESEQYQFNHFKSEKRKTEFLAARIVLEGILGYKPEINYTEHGKPILPNSTLHLSISHSGELVAVFLSDRKVGVDVENIHRNIDKVAHRFLHEKEKNFIDSTSSPQLAKIILWSAKEALFKCTEETGVQFNEQIIIFPFNIKNKGSFVGSLNNSVPYKFWYEFYENNVIVFCVEE